MVLNKWAVALLQLVFVAITALQVYREGGLTETEAWQFGALVISAAAAVYLKLLKGGWHQALKVSAAIAGAVIAAIIPIVNDTWTLDTWILIILAALNALVIHFGVNARIDGVEQVLADPSLANRPVAVVDPTVTEIVLHKNPGLLRNPQPGDLAAPVAGGVSH